MEHPLPTTIAVTSLLPTTDFAGPIHNAAYSGNIVAFKQHLVAGADVNTNIHSLETPLDQTIENNKTEIANLLRKHVDKTMKELQ